MNDLNAAIGLIQLGKLEASNAQRREIVSQYGKAFSGLPWLRRPVEKSYARSAYHAYVVRLEDQDGLIEHLAERGIDAGVHYKPNHLHSVYACFRRELPVAESVWQELVTLPLYPSITEGEVSHVVEAVSCFQPDGRSSSAEP